MGAAGDTRVEGTVLVPAMVLRAVLVLLEATLPRGVVTIMESRGAR
jgi:hypothetical protein